jgi:hypothetical protein
MSAVCWAITTGCRGNVGTITVPILSGRLVAAPASTVNPSGPEPVVSHTAGTPAVSACAIACNMEPGGTI